jgi:hypothetical protein
MGISTHFDCMAQDRWFREPGCSKTRLRVQSLIAAAVAVMMLTAIPQRASAEETHCDPSRIKGLIGKSYSDELAEDARRASGAASVRPIGSGKGVSSDFLPDRLNVWLNNAGIVVGFICG